MKIKNIDCGAFVSATMLGQGATSALAQATGGNTGDSSAPIEFLRTVHSKASTSSLNASSIATGGNNAGEEPSAGHATHGRASATTERRKRPGGPTRQASFPAPSQR